MIHGVYDAYSKIGPWDLAIIKKIICIHLMLTIPLGSSDLEIDKV